MTARARRLLAPPIVRPLVAAALLVSVFVAGCGHSCPDGTQEVCQSGPKYGTKCYCVAPTR